MADAAQARRVNLARSFVTGLEGCVDCGWITHEDMLATGLMAVAQIIADAPISPEEREKTIAMVRENLGGMVALARGESSAIAEAAGQRLQ